MTQEEARDFVKYSFYKVSPEWRRLSRQERERSKEEFAATLGEFTDRISVSSYSLVGTRGDVDFMLWKVSRSLESIDELMAQLNRTELAGYLQTPHSYLAMTRRSPYIDDHQHEGQEGATATMRIVGRKYLFVYPFIKTHDWYQQPQEERQRMMNEHFRNRSQVSRRENQHVLLLWPGRPGVRAGLRDGPPGDLPGPGNGPAQLGSPPLHRTRHSHLHLPRQANSGVP